MTTPRSFIIIGVILLLWNLMGLAAFAMQYGADLDQLARTDPDTARAFAAMPGWAWAVYGFAVGTGALGAILLLMKKAMAAAMFLLSVIAVVIQFGHTFLGTDLLAVKGPGTLAFPVLICIIGVAQFLYARAMVAKGLLKG